MSTRLILAIHTHFAVNPSAGYALGAVIALLILGYLVYSLIKPEKF
jgi:K+-transporting ATPase KdpF subunit